MAQPLRRELEVLFIDGRDDLDWLRNNSTIFVDFVRDRHIRLRIHRWDGDIRTFPTTAPIFVVVREGGFHMGSPMWDLCVQAGHVALYGDRPLIGPNVFDTSYKLKDLARELIKRRALMATQPP